MTQRIATAQKKVEAPKVAPKHAEAKPAKKASNAVVHIPREVLKEGSKGTHVAHLQRQLKHAGFNPGPIDGQFGPHTKKALEGFQHKHGMSADGIAGRAVWKKLGGEKGPIPNTLKRGDTGLHVKDLQRELKQAGFHPGPVDGQFGPHTEAAVKSFQKAHGLTPTGNAGHGVWSKLGGDRFIGAHPRHSGGGRGSRGVGDAPPIGGDVGNTTSTMRRLAEAGRNAAMSIGGYTSHGLCATGVSRALSALGIHVGGNGNQIDNNLPRDKFREINIPLSEALKRPGLILTFEHTPTRLGSIYGHTAITLGDGHSSASDFIERDTLSGSAGRSGLKIFEPTF